MSRLARQSVRCLSASLAVLLACPAFGGPDVDESTSTRPDAGSTVKSAKVAKGEGSIQSARGTLAIGFVAGDAVDMFIVRVADPASFSAVVVSAGFDPALYLFRVTADGSGNPEDGFAVSANDDNGVGDPFSKLFFPPSPAYPPGIYAIAIASSGTKPATYPSDGPRAPAPVFDYDQYALMTPTGAGFELPLRIWDGRQSGGGEYVIEVSGAELIPTRFAGVCGDIFSGDCMLPHATKGCDDPVCCTLVCGIDPYCCTAEWDANCAGIAVQNCQSCSAAPATCVPDLNGSGSVDGGDLSILLGAWGQCN